MGSHMTSSGTFSVIADGVEVDFALEADGTLGVILVEEGEQISGDIPPTEARALRDWLVKALPDG